VAHPAICRSAYPCRQARHERAQHAPASRTSGSPACAPVPTSATGLAPQLGIPNGSFRQPLPPRSVVRHRGLPRAMILSGASATRQAQPSATASTYLRQCGPHAATARARCQWRCSQDPSVVIACVVTKTGRDWWRTTRPLSCRTGAHPHIHLVKPALRTSGAVRAWSPICLRQARKNRGAPAPSGLDVGP